MTMSECCMHPCSCPPPLTPHTHTLSPSLVPDLSLGPTVPRPETLVLLHPNTHTQGSGWGGSTLDLYVGSTQHILTSASLLGATTAFGSTTISIPLLASSVASQPYPLPAAPGSSIIFTYGYTVGGR